MKKIFYLICFFNVLLFAEITQVTKDDGWTYFYDNGTNFKKEKYLENETLVYNLDSYGNEILFQRKDISGNTLSSTEFEYFGSTKIKEIRYSGDGNMLFYSEWYNNGNTKNTSMYDSTGSITDFSSWNSDGNLLYNSSYFFGDDPRKGQIRSENTNAYDESGKKISTSSFYYDWMNPDLKILYSVDFNSDGSYKESVSKVNVKTDELLDTTVKFYDSSGTLKEYPDCSDGGIPLIYDDGTSTCDRTCKSIGMEVAIDGSCQLGTCPSPPIGWIQASTLEECTTFDTSIYDGSQTYTNQLNCPDVCFLKTISDNDNDNGDNDNDNDNGDNDNDNGDNDGGLSKPPESGGGTGGNSLSDDLKALGKNVVDNTASTESNTIALNNANTSVDGLNESVTTLNNSISDITKDSDIGYASVAMSEVTNIYGSVDLGYCATNCSCSDIDDIGFTLSNGNSVTILSQDFINTLPMDMIKNLIIFSFVLSGVVMALKQS